MTEGSHRLEARIEGKVQGVGFRHFATLEARRRMLSGFVRNERDGTVTVISEGSAENLDDFLEALRDGPPSARVSEIRSSREPATGEFQGFEVRWG